MKFTAEQEAAIFTHDRNLIVVAGAGSGKTRVLVERYMALLDSHPDWPLGALVAITFTRKAAGEMRDRVRAALAQRLESAATQAARDRWTALLNEVDGARIDTIHGLCASILKANAATLGIDPDFDVLDEVESAVLREQVAEVALVDAAADETLVQLFATYSPRELRAVLLDQLAGPVPDLMPGDEPLMVAWRRQWEAYTLAIVRQAATAMQRVPHLDAPVPPDKLGTTYRDALRLADELREHSTPDALLIRLHQLTALNLRGGSKKTWNEGDLAQAKGTVKGIRALAKAALDDIGDAPGPLDEVAASLLPLWATLIDHAGRRYLAAKTDAVAVDFDDLERMTCDLLESDPAVAARYRGTEFKHLLVDEFQDTNDQQWRIVKALADVNEGGAMFVVGDPKQSIYAFRGADVSVFDQVRQEIIGRDVGAATTLSRSFRTHAPLVDCFNAVFGVLMQRDPESPVAAYQVERGQPMTAHRETAPTDEPPLELLLIPQTEQGSDERIRAEDRRRWEADMLAERLLDLVRSGRRIWDKGAGMTRPVGFGDVALLFQSLANVTLYEAAFKAIGIPFVTVAGRGYYDRQEVWDLLNMLQAIYTPLDDLALASALRSPLFGLSDDALLALRLPSEESGAPRPLFSVLCDPQDAPVPAHEYDRLTFACRCLNELIARAGRVTISELMQDLLAQTGYLAVLTGLPDGARRRRNIEKLLDIAYASGLNSLPAFTRYLRGLSDRETREGEAVLDVADVVQIMSVHASKGLEFPVVVLADASWQRRGAVTHVLRADVQAGGGLKVYDPEAMALAPTFAYRYIGWLAGQRDEAERLRLLYVGATRAQDLLIVSGQVDEKDDEPVLRGWLAHLAQALDLADGVAVRGSNVWTYDWGHLRLTCPEARRVVSDDVPADGVYDDWLTNVPEIEPARPPLLAALPQDRLLRVRHLAATHIADLGSAENLPLPDRLFYRDRFRRQVLHDAPATVEQVGQQPRVRPYQIGEMVHEALRHWHLPDNMDHESLRALLQAFAWRQAITDAADVQDAVAAAHTLLGRFARSTLRQQIEDARQVYRELPFIYRREQYIVHGVIDVLFQKSDGAWVIADYKTSTVSHGEALSEHVRRYYLQLGVYADAVSQMLNGLVPHTVVHYIRRTETVAIREQDWRPVLERTLASRIREIIEEQRR